MKHKNSGLVGLFFLVLIFSAMPRDLFAAQASDYKSIPPFASNQVPPLVMLVMDRSHKLYYEAYNDASDLNDDGILDVGYKGEDEQFTDNNHNGVGDATEQTLTQDANGDGKWTKGIDYYGYFDSYKCYAYDSTANRFVPESTTANKKCAGHSGRWSGDFLNYVTMSRMDTMRKVLYGGYRIPLEDTATSTVLQRSYIPQDAHSWGKEYNPGKDYYKISDYTPLAEPIGPTRHIFVNTTLTSETSPPLLRVLENSARRVWDWVACEVPVAGNDVKEKDGVTVKPVTDNGIISPYIDETNGGPLGGLMTDIGNNPAAETVVKLFDDSSSTKWLTKELASGATPVWVKFQFSTPKKILKYTLTTANDEPDRDPKTWMLKASNDNLTWTTLDTVPNGLLSDVRFTSKEFTCAVQTTIAYTYYVLEITANKGGGGNYTQIAEMEMIENIATNATPANATLTDYQVNVEVCKSTMPEANCKQYPDLNYKPTGLLQKNGESDSMYFGLLTGSYTHNTQGGVVRKNISSIKDEINLTTNGTFTAANGIIGTLNKLRIHDFNYGSHSYSTNCGSNGWMTDRAINDGECRNWGNPIGEMLYESLRYFAGTSKTTDFNYDATTTFDDNQMGLAKPDWVNPYNTTNGYPYCSKPFMLVISDINPSYDSDLLPGVDNDFGTKAVETIGNASSSLNVTTLANSISSDESITGLHYIGQVNATADTACTAKDMTGLGLGNIRGLCPEEPTKQGSYYAAAAANYGRTQDINTVQETQNVMTYAVGLASPLPRIEIPVWAGTTKKTITLVPFAKSIAGGGVPGFDAAHPGGRGLFQPTCTIVDFFVENIDLINGYGKFRINYEDVEQAADHDMDFVAIYEYQIVNAAGVPVLANNPAGVKVDVKVSFDYAAGGITQVAGYIISGTGNTTDGIYLEVHDENAAAPRYFLNTPEGCGPNTGVSDTCWNSADLPGGPTSSAVKFHTRTFTADPTATAATLLKNPLWYAAKWGGFIEKENDVNSKPDKTSEWDENSDGVPDTYFYVTNPLKLEDQLNKSFADILKKAASGTAASVISNSRSGEGAVYQSIFYPQLQVGDDTLTWIGDVHALFTDSHGNMREDTNGKHQLNIHKEDLNGNGALDAHLSEDVNNNHILDKDLVLHTTEDLNHNGKLDTDINEDLNGNGVLDTRDLIIVFDGQNVYKYDDANENEIIDNEDTIKFEPDILAWHNNNILNTEDLNHNGILDPGEDINGNGILDFEDKDGNGVLTIERPSVAYKISDIEFLWSAADWLNQDSLVPLNPSDPSKPLDPLNPVTQRSPYATAADQRYIITFVDKDKDGIVDAGEQIPFINDSATPAATNLTNTATVYPYLTLFPTYPLVSPPGDKPQWLNAIDVIASDALDFRAKQAERLVNYIRGQDQEALVVNSKPVPDMRKRVYIDEKDLKTKTWRLGDIVHSSPTLVARPQEGYHLLYRDDSYADFAAKYQSRRAVVYVGANDGMIHAFNAGFFDSKTLSFLTTTSSGQTPFALGSELWAYVPYNLLPHLYWLTEADYPHVYYNDLQPKVFDAKIFFNADGVTALDTDHPNGWGTVMVVGMRFGGSSIVTDMKTTVTTDDRTMTSAYVVFDITNPELPPTVLAEIAVDKLGYTTCYPAVIPMRSKTGRGNSIMFNSNDWYLVFGSGPADSNGVAASNAGFDELLKYGMSKQTGKLYVLDLKKLTSKTAAQPAIISTLNESGEPTSTAPYYIQQLEANSFVSQPISVDFNLDYNADTVYFGTISGGLDHWAGRMRRLLVDNEVANATGNVNWVDNNLDLVDRADNWLIDLSSVENGQPISAAASVTIGERMFNGTSAIDVNGDGVANDFDRERWVFFGTGRFYVRKDAENTDQQSYYGIKEPIYTSGTLNRFSGKPVDRATLLNVTAAEVFDEKDVAGVSVAAVTGMGATANWNQLLAAIKPTTNSGWYQNFTTSKERNLGQATLLGELLTFTTYIPSVDICSFEGNSWLSAVFYRTGTAYPESAIGYTVVETISNGFVDEGEKKMRKKVDLGAGLSLTPNIHTGREEGSRAYIQTSTGAIETIEQINPGMTKSGKTSWLLR